MTLQKQIRVSTPQIEGVMRTSKWIKYPVLLSIEEAKDLFDSLGDLFFYIVSDPIKLEEAVFDKNKFYDLYASYVEALQNGEHPDEATLRPFFSAALSLTPDVMYAMAVGKEKFLLKAVKPVIQMQMHHFIHSKVDGSFHSMVQGKESISWGFQLSYPQIFQKPKDHDFSKVGMQDEFPNSPLFYHIVKWLRKNTLPTPFLFNSIKKSVPIRIGKKSFEWIHKHPGLQASGLEVIPYQLRNHED